MSLSVFENPSSHHTQHVGLAVVVVVEVVVEVVVDVVVEVVVEVVVGGGVSQFTTTVSPPNPNLSGSAPQEQSPVQFSEWVNQADSQM